MTPPKNSILEEVSSSKHNKSSKRKRRNSLNSVNTDLIFEGTVSELELQQKESMNTIGSARSIEDDP